MALVAAVQNYKMLPQLANTIADANLISDKLRAADFEVDVALDPGKADLSAALRNFARKVEAAGPETVALIYFAGHGVQDKKQINYIIGSDADLKSDVDLPIEALPIDTVLATLGGAGPKLIFAIFDACRNDPLPESSTRGTRRGLAPEDKDKTPPGALIAYSTEPGKEAEDGPPGGHSPFALALADGLSKRGVESVRMFQLVARQVLETTTSKQFPWVEPQRVTTDFYFLKGPAASTLPPNLMPAGLSAEPSKFDAGEAEYGRVVTSVNPDDYTDWMRKYPDHPLLPNVRKLRQRLVEESLWKRAEAAVSVSDKIDALDRLLMAFPPPLGVYAEKAQEKKRELTEASAPPAPAPTLVTGPPLSPVRRYQDTDAPGNDLGDWIANSDVDRCEAICQANLNCVGYTFNEAVSVCIPKRRLAQLVASTERAVTGVLFDRVPDPDAIAPQRHGVRKEFRRIQGQISLGYDLGKPLSLAIDGCEDACSAQPECRGYVYDLHFLTCWLKTNIGPLKPARVPAVTGEAVDAVSVSQTHAQSTPRLRTYAGQILIGHDLGGRGLSVSIGACADSCVKEARCAGYVYDFQASVCWLKSSSGPLTASRIAAVTVFVDRD